MKGAVIVITLMASALAFDLTCETKHPALAQRVTSSGDIPSLFPTTPAAIESQVNEAMAKAKKAIEQIIAVPDDKRTYENTAQALDTVSALSDLAIIGTIVSILEMVSPEESIRTAAHAAIQKIDEFVVDTISNNVKLYEAFKSYAQENALKEQLSFEQRYYIQEKMKEFERSGLNLPEETRAKIAQLKKELAKLSQDFEVNIAQDNRTIEVPLEALQGLDADFIASLKKTEDGKYILGVDYPTINNVMENCSVGETRKKLFIAFNNRAYPANEDILKAVIAKRDELAHLLGFASYADLNMANSMVGTPEKAEHFLQELLVRCAPKVEQEFATITADLPEGITLSADGKINPWDWSYTKACYKKKNFTIDERKIAEYFPMEKTIKGLLDIYRQFLGVDFKEAPISNLWHPDVKLVEVYDINDGSRLGYLLLDLHPRPNKYSHACEIEVVPSVYGNNDAKPAAISLVIANFQKSTATKPSLLRRDEVKTFFHEFGHALHALLGRTKVASQSGTAVKRDFVEMPSQMLEEWLWDKGILKMISHHYQTGEPLPDDLIERIQALKNFDSGDWTQRQAFLSEVSLAYYKPGAHKDVNGIMKELQKKIRVHVVVDPNDHFEASFGHLMGYGAQYYGYLWSKVFALDMFYEIKKHGLLNPLIGRRYVHDVIGKGGSDDPNVLLETFLGRKPSQDAFFKDLGLEEPVLERVVDVVKESLRPIPAVEG